MSKLINWNNIKLDSRGRIVKSQRENVVQAVDMYLKKPYKVAQAELQEFTTLGDFPAPGRSPQKIFQKLPTYDMGYERIFDMVDFTGTTDSGFRIDDVEDSLAYAEVLPGEKLKVFQAKGSSTEYEFKMYGGALGWHRTLFMDRDWWRIEQTTKTFRAKYWEYYADIHYTLIETATGTTAWQNPVPATLPNTDAQYTANRDAQTINSACISILTNCDGLGYEGIAPLNANFKILVPLQLMQRIREAVNTLLQPTASSINRIPFNYEIIPTAMLSSSSVYYVILPGNKLISGKRMDLTTFEEFDMMSFSDTMAAWMRLRAVIGNQNQIQKCSTA